MSIRECDYCKESMGNSMNLEGDRWVHKKCINIYIACKQMGGVTDEYAKLQKGVKK